MRALRCAAAGLLALAVPAFAAPQAALAQTDAKLVGNSEQSALVSAQTTHDQAQAFTTGSHALGYRLTSADIVFQKVGGTGTPPTYTVEIWSDSSGSPGSLVGTLTNPASLSSVSNFAAPGNGIDLAAETTYHLVWNVSATGSTSDNEVRFTPSDAEDEGAAAGWSIADGSSYRTFDSTGDWTADSTNSLRMAIYGAAKDNVPPRLSAAKVGEGGTTLILVYDEALNATAPAASAFTVTAGGADNTVSAAVIAGSTVRLTLGAAVTTGQAVTVDYTVPTANPIEDLDGNEAAALTGESVTIDTTGPNLVAATVDGTTLTLTWDELLDESSVTPAGFFLVAVDGFIGTYDPTASSIAGATVTLTLAQAVVSSTQEVVLGYDSVLASIKLKDLFGNEAPTVPDFPGFPVTVIETTAPVLSRAAAEGTALKLTYDEFLDESSAPAASAFTVTVAGSSTTHSPSAVAVWRDSVTLTLSAAVASGQTVTVSYAVPSANPIRDGGGNEAAALTDQAVTLADVTAPTLASAIKNGTALTLTYDEALDTASSPDLFSFEVMDHDAGTTDSPNNIAITGSTVVLTMSRATASGGQRLTLDYEVPTRNPIQDPAGNDAAGLTGHAIVIAETTAPTLQSATVDGAALTLTYDERLDTGSVPAATAFDVTVGTGTGANPSSVSVTGMTVVLTLASAVTTGQMVTVSYTVPSDNPIQDLAATANPAAALTDRTVTNETKSTDAALSALAVTDGSDNAQTLTPAFDAATTAYTVAVTNAVQNAKVTATVNDTGKATLEGSLTKAGGAAEDVSMTDATAALLSNLAVGANVLTITVTAEDDATTRDYTLTITREGPPTASIMLSGMASVMAGESLTLDGSGSEDPDGGTLTYAWTAADSNGADVTDDVFPDGTEAATAVFATDDMTATGDYTVTLTVTDDDNTSASTATAMLTVTVTNISTDATLMALAAMAGTNALTLSPAFASDTMDYTATVGADVTSVDVTATVNHMAATLAGSLTRAGGTAEDVPMTNGAATLSNLPPGDSVLTITVTAEDDATTQVYTLTLMRKVPPTVSIAPSGDQRVAPETDLMLTATGEDPDGGAVTYAWTAVASDPAMTGSVLSANDTASVTFNAAMPGSWAVTVTVTDDESQTAMASLRVTVVLDTEMRAKAVTKVLAAAGVRTLSGVLDNVGARLGGAPGPSLTLAGENVPLGAASSAGLACEPDVFGRHECAPDMRGASALDLFSSSAFSLAAGAAGGEAMADPDAPRWAVWGRGDAGAFEGSPDGMSYDGKTLTGWLGVDARAGQWVAGVALSRGETEADYEFDAGGGETGAGSLETTLTSVYPYGRWTFDEGYEVRGIVGVGTGEARHRSKEEGAAEETSDLTMWMASAGVRRPLPPTAGISLAARGEVSLVQMETGDGEETIDGLSAQGWRGRAGVEGSGRHLLPNGGLLEPFAEAGVRQDGGDGLEGSGVELAGGVRYNVKRLHVEVRGRWLAAHTEEGAKEHGLSATVRLDADALRRGFSFALTPRWGSSASGSDALWKDDLPRPGSAAAAETAIDARLGYGVGMPRGALLTPFAETGVAENRRFRLGARYEALRALSLEVSGERRESATAEPEHALGLDLRLRF